MILPLAEYGDLQDLAVIACRKNEPLIPLAEVKRRLKKNGAFEVSFRRSVERDLRKLDQATQAQVLKAVDDLSRAPRSSGCRKLQGGEDAFHIRLGD